MEKPFETVTLKAFREIMDKLRKIKGGYEYSGMVSYQICFPLKAGGELRFGVYEDEDVDGKLNYTIDLYSGKLPPGITGPTNKTN